MTHQQGAELHVQVVVVGFTVFFGHIRTNDHVGIKILEHDVHGEIVVQTPVEQQTIIDIDGTQVKGIGHASPYGAGQIPILKNNGLFVFDVRSHTAVRHHKAVEIIGEVVRHPGKSFHEVIINGGGIDYIGGKVLNVIAFEIVF